MGTILELIAELAIAFIPHDAWARVLFFAVIIAITVGAVYLVMR